MGYKMDKVAKNFRKNLILFIHYNNYFTTISYYLNFTLIFYL